LLRVLFVYFHKGQLTTVENPGIDIV